MKQYDRTTENMPKADLVELCFIRASQIEALKRELKTYDNQEDALCRIVELCRFELKDKAALAKRAELALTTIMEIAGEKND